MEAFQVGVRGGYPTTGLRLGGRLAIVSGLSVRVHDAYVTGEGILHASLLGLFPLVDMRGGGNLAKGELMRFFAEAAWYPTALLPTQRRYVGKP